MSSTGYRPISASTPTRAWPTTTWAHRPSGPSFTASPGFTFGAYADPGLDRTGILRQAVERGEAMLGEDVPDIDILVVGDTRRDVDPPHAAGCTALVVATGHHDAAPRREADADRVLPTLVQEVLR